MTKHTKGPWRWEKSRSLHHLQGPRGSLGISTGKELDANAALIAAAPELLEALKGLIDCNLMRNLVGGYQFQIEQAEKAIAKAEGR